MCHGWTLYRHMRSSVQMTTGKTYLTLVTSFNHWTMHNKLDFVHTSWSFRIPFAFNPLSSVRTWCFRSWPKPKKGTGSISSIQEHFLFNIELFRFWIICFPKVNFCFRRLSNEMRSELLFHSQTNAFLYSYMTELTSHEPIRPHLNPFDP